MVAQMCIMESEAAVPVLEQSLNKRIENYEIIEALVVELPHVECTRLS